jgi:hypothetical protein
LETYQINDEATREGRWESDRERKFDRAWKLRLRERDRRWASAVARPDLWWCAVLAVIGRRQRLRMDSRQRREIPSPFPSFCSAAPCYCFCSFTVSICSFVFYCLVVSGLMVVDGEGWWWFWYCCLKWWFNGDNNDDVVWWCCYCYYWLCDNNIGYGGIDLRKMIILVYDDCFEVIGGWRWLKWVMVRKTKVDGAYHYCSFPYFFLFFFV